MRHISAYRAEEDCSPPSPALFDQEEEDMGEINKLDFKHIIYKCKQMFYHTRPLLMILLC